MPNIQELKPFNNICDEFVSGKYILVDIKISSILKLIAEDEKLTNIVNSCLNDYNFVEEFKKHSALNNQTPYITLPSTEKEVVAFVYNLLYKFKAGNIDFYQFLTTYFNADNDNNKEFSEFAKSIIIPFKNAINVIYSKRHIPDSLLLFFPKNNVCFIKQD